MSDEMTPKEALADFHSKIMKGDLSNIHGVSPEEARVFRRKLSPFETPTQNVGAVGVRLNLPERVHTRRCESMTQMLRYFDFAKEMGHGTYYLSDPKARLLGFMDADLSVAYELHVTALKKMNESEQELFGSAQAIAEHFGSLDDYLGFEEDPDVGELPENFLDAATEAGQQLWDLTGGSLEPEVAEVQKVDLTIQPDGHREPLRDKFHYIQPVSKDLGKDTGGHKQDLRSYKDVDKFAEKMKEIAGAPLLVWDENDKTGLRLKAIKTTQGLLKPNQQALISAVEAGKLISQLADHRKATVMFEFNCDEPPGS
jgi:hypothetical protein